MNAAKNQKELTIDFNLPQKMSDGSDLTASHLRQVIVRHDADIVTVKGNPEPEFAHMLEALKQSGMHIVTS